MNTNKQNKRFLSFILALVLVATMIFTPAVVWADHSHNGQDFTDSNTWNPGTITAGTNYHLATDTAITNSAHLSITVNPFTLCLYGKILTINDTSANTGFVIGLPEGNGVFNLYDDGGGQIRLSDSDSGSIINIQKGTFNMYGGTLAGNGSISDGVRVSSGTAFNMYGGTITNNDYGVYLVSGAEFNMYGGTVTGSSIRGVDVNGGTFSVSGSAVVSGNIFNGKPRNVVLKTSENDVINVVGPLTAGASIGVTLLDGSSDPTIGVITSGWAISMGNADPTAYFKADAEGFYITLAAVNSTTEVAIQAGLATEPTISAITGADLTYGYTGGNIHVTAEAPSAHTLSYQWYKCDSDGSNELSIGGADSASYVILTGKNAGTYYYKCKVTATRDDNHMSASTMSAVAAVTVSPKAITVTAIDQTIAIGGSISQTVDKVNVTGLLEGHSISYIALTSSPTDVATTNGSITPSAATIMAGSDYVTSNYTATYLPGKLIVKGIPVYTAPTAKDLTYDGSAQELLNAGSTSDGTIQYRLNQFADFDTAIPSETAAGTYEVWWKIDGDEYHESIAATKVAITIKQKTVTASGLAVGNKIYDGTTDAALDISGATLTDVIPADAENVSVTGHAFFADKNAGDDKTATIVGLTLSGIRANNYKLSFTTTPAAANITAKAITIDSLGMHDKVYDGTTVAAINTGSVGFTGKIAGDDLTVTGIAMFADKNVGKGKTVSISALSLAGTDAGNYQLTNTITTASATITQKAINISGVTAYDKTYDGTTAASINISNAAFAGKIDGDILSVTGTAVFTAKDAGTGKSVNVSGLSLTGADAANYLLSNTTCAGTANISQKTVTVSGLSVDDKTYDATTYAALNLSNATVSGIVPGDILVVTGSAAFADRNTGADKTVNISGLSLGGISAGNYVLASTTSSAFATITAKAITVTANAITKTYGDLDPVLTYTSDGGLLAGDSFSGSLVRDAGKNVSTYAIGIGTLSAGNNYSITFIPSTFTITPKPLTITVGSVTKTYGDADPDLYSYLTGSSVYTTGDGIEVSVTRVSGENVSTYAISLNVTQGAIPNYIVTTSAGVFTISPKAINVYADPQTKVEGTSDPILTYTSDGGLVGTDNFTGSLTRATGEAVGVYAITQGSLSAGGNYIINFTNSTLTITAAPVPPGGGGGSGGSSDNGLLIKDAHTAYMGGYEDGTIKPENRINRAEVAMIFYRLLKNQKVNINVSFPDVEKGKWYETAVNTLASLKIINGDNKGNFRPDDLITRAEFASIATRFGPQMKTDTEFTDVAPSHWAYNSIRTAYANGWINGYPDGSFGPDKPVTRAEVMAVVNRILERKGDKEYIDEHPDKIKQFTDLQDQDKWYYYDVIEATNDHEFTRTKGVEHWQQDTAGEMR